MNRTDSTSRPASPSRPAFSWLREWWSRLAGGLALAVVAAVTGRISYMHIEALTLALHQPLMVARLMPFGVDGLIVVGSVVLLQAAAVQWWLGWCGVAPGIAASLFANIESGLRYGTLAAIWAGVPAASFALATFMFERWLKAQAETVAHAGPGGSADPLERGQDGAVSPGVLAASTEDEPRGTLTQEAALLALIRTGSRREIAGLLNVPKTRVDRWAARLAQPAQVVPETAGAPLPGGVAALNGHQDA